MNSNYIVIEMDILESDILTSTDKILYGYIVALSYNEYHECFISSNALCEKLNISKRSLCYSLSKLKKYHFIELRYEKNKRFIKPTINKFIEYRDKENKKIIENDFVDYDWLNE